MEAFPPARGDNVLPKEASLSLKCQKASVRSFAAQWNLGVLVSTETEDSIPCFFSVVPTWCTFQTVSSEEGAMESPSRER